MREPAPYMLSYTIVVTQNESDQGFGQGKMMISLSYKDLLGTISIL